MDEKTSDEIASLAAKGLKDPRKLTANEIRAICGSVLSQAPDNPSMPDAPKGPGFEIVP